MSIVTIYIIYNLDFSVRFNLDELPEFLQYLNDLNLLILIRLSPVSKEEVERLLTMYNALTAGGVRLDRTKFRDVLHNTFDMTDDILMDRGTSTTVI